MDDFSSQKVSLSFFKEYILPNIYDENMFNSDGSLNPKYNSFKKTGTIAQIFDDHWQSVYFKHKDIIDLYRPNANYEINKVIDCYNNDLGFSIYECPECHDLVFIGNTCKSRLGSSCGYKYKMEGLKTFYKQLINVNTDKLFLLSLKNFVNFSSFLLMK